MRHYVPQIFSFLSLEVKQLPWAYNGAGSRIFFIKIAYLFQF